MAWTFDTQTIFDGERKHTVKVVGTSDGTAAEGTVTAVDKSTLSAGRESVARLVVESMEWSSSVKLRAAFDHDTDDEIANITGEGFFDWRSFGGVPDPDSTGGTGDITISTDGTAANDQFTVTMVCRKKVD